MAKIGTIKMDTQSGVIELSVFELSDAGSKVNEFVRVRTASGSGFIPLADETDARYPQTRVQTRSQGIMSFHNEATLSIRPDSGISRWTFDNEDTDGLTTIDTWGNNNGSIEGGGIKTGSEGQLSESYDIDGTEGYVNIPHSSSIDIRRTISFSFWVYVDSFVNTWHMLFGKIAQGSSTSGRTYSVWLNENGYMHLTSTSNEQGQTRLNTSSGSIQLGNWYHYAGVIDRNKGQLRAYINGDRKTSKSIDTNDTVSHTDPLRIGFDAYSGNSSYSPLNGKIDDVRLYDKALSDQEVSDLYSNGSIKN